MIVHYSYKRRQDSAPLTCVSFCYEAKLPRYIIPELSHENSFTGYLSHSNGMTDLTCRLDKT